MTEDKLQLNIETIPEELITIPRKSICLYVPQKAQRQSWTTGIVSVITSVELTSPNGRRCR